MTERRVRKPTLRALDAAESNLLAREAPPSRKRSALSPSYPSTSSSSAAAPVKRNGRPQNDKGKQAIAQQQALLQGQQQAFLVDPPEDEDGEDSGEGMDQDEPLEQDLTLYCVCLGYDTGEQPMIQCEHCSNWFHFSCVSLTDDSAATIEAYSCDMCEQMGMGSTRFLATAAAAGALPLGLPPTVFNPSLALAPQALIAPQALQADGHFDLADLPTSDEGEDDDEEIEEEDEDDEDFEENEAAAARKKRKTTRAGRKRTRGADEDWGSESDGEEEAKTTAKRPPRKKRPSMARQSVGDVKPVLQGPAPSVPRSDKTRSAVIQQLTNLFSSIFSASGSSDGIDIRSAALAEEVESELFEVFAELDDKGTRAPRPKYANKFRSLAFNLKTNAVLRSRVGANELSASKIANLTAEDLQTPELRAMAENIRAASLKFSVKEAIAAPTAKRTHKGEEAIDNEASAIVAAEEAARAQNEATKKRGERERSGSVSVAGSPAPFPGTPTVGSPAGTPQSPRDPMSGFFPTVASASSSNTPRVRSSLPTSSLAHSTSSVNDYKLNGAAAASPSSRTSQQGSPPPLGSNAASPQVLDGAEDEGEMSPPPLPEKRRSSSNFDMASIWGKAKAASPTIPSGETMPALEIEDEGDDEPFSFSGAGRSSDDGFDEDDLFRDPNASPKKKAPPPPPAPRLEDLTSVWTGDVLVPEEGGFPSLAVQVGGRPLGFEPSVWKKLMPRAFTTAGRIATQQALKYLVDCSFSPKRELVVVALLADLSGPTPDNPHKPASERCQKKHQHIFDVYVKRDRIGVVQPPKEVQGLVRDIYLVPLKKDDPIPEFVELADEHCIPEGKQRRQDLLLAVLVVQKGVLPTVKPAPPAAVAAEPKQASPPPPPASLPPPIPTGPKAMTALPTGPRAMQGHSPSPSLSTTGNLSPPPPSHPYQPYHSPPPVAAFVSAPPPPPPAAFDPASVQSLLSSLDPNAISSLFSNPTLLGALGNGASPAPPPQQQQQYGYNQQQQQYSPINAAGGGGGGGRGGRMRVDPSRAVFINGGVLEVPPGPGAGQYGGGGGAGEPHRGAWDQQQQQQQASAWDSGRYGGQQQHGGQQGGQGRW